MPKYEPGHFNQNKYIADYKREFYDRMELQVPKGGKDIIKALAKQNNCSVNVLIMSALENQYGITLQKEKD